MAKDIIEVDAKKFSNFLNKIYLGGLLNECVLYSKGESVAVNSIDHSNIIFLSVEEDVDISSLGVLGIGDIGIIAKFIADCPHEKLKLIKKSNRLMLSHSGIKIEYLLTDPVLITTRVEGGKISEIINNCDYSFKLTQEVKEAFLSAVNLLKVKTISIEVHDNKVLLKGGLSHEHNFDLDPIPLEEGVDSTNFICSFYADYLKAVFSVLDFEEYEDPLIRFSPEYPMVVQEADNSWAIFPLTLD